MKRKSISFLPARLRRILWLALTATSLVVSAGLSHAATIVSFCNGSDQKIYVAQYETYQGLLAGYSVNGWHDLQDGRYCYQAVVEARAVRAFAFAAFDENGLMIPMHFDIGWSDGAFSRSTEAVCVPVERARGRFDIAAPAQAGVTPPCGPGHARIDVSLNVRGGDINQNFVFNIPESEVSPGRPDPEYRRIWEERFGPLPAAAAGPDPDAAAQRLAAALVSKQQRERRAAIEAAAGQQREQRAALEARDSDAFLRQCFASVQGFYRTRKIVVADVCLCVEETVIDSGDSRFYDRLVADFWATYQPIAMSPGRDEFQQRLSDCWLQRNLTAGSIERISRWRSEKGIPAELPVPVLPNYPEGSGANRGEAAAQLGDAQRRIEAWLN